MRIIRVGNSCSYMIAFLLIVVALALACASAEPTPTPILPAKPAPPAAPTPVLQPTAAPAPQATALAPVVITPTPTRALPTPTPSTRGGPRYGGTLRFVSDLRVDTMDPSYNTLAGAFPVFNAVYDQLVRLDQQSNFYPGLAETWEFAADGKTITFKLRKGIKFQDGTPFDAQAVKWNYDRMMDPDQFSGRRPELQPYLKSVDAADEYTIRFNLITPYRPLLSQLGSDRMGWLVSPAAVQKFGGGVKGNYGRNPVGTGPFKFKEWVPDSHILVEKVDKYWEEGKPYLDRILFQSTPERSIMLAMIRTDETDMVWYNQLTIRELPLVESDPKLRVIPIRGAGTAILHFNASKPPFDSQALRQAIGFAIDRQTLVNVLYGGEGKPAYSMIAAGWAYNPDIKVIYYDLDKAKQKLAEAGYPKGLSLPIGCQPTGIYFETCEALQAMLKNVGININMELIPVANYFAMDDKGYFRRQGFGASTWAHRIDPHILMQALWHKDGFKVLRTYDNPELNSLIVEAATVYDTAKAKAMYDKMQTMAAESAIVLFLQWGDKFQPMNKRVQNFVPLPSIFEHLEFVWLDR